jgi:hypothetical protein
MSFPSPLILSPPHFPFMDWRGSCSSREFLLCLWCHWPRYGIIHSPESGNCDYEYVMCIILILQVKKTFCCHTDSSGLLDLFLYHLCVYMLWIVIVLFYLEEWRHGWQFIAVFTEPRCVARHTVRWSRTPFYSYGIFMLLDLGFGSCFIHTRSCWLLLL